LALGFPSFRLFVLALIKGGALAYTYVGHIITETTRRELGVAVNPHLFRDCAVYTVAINAGDRMGIASGLLQHTDQRTVEKYYNKGASVGAVRRYQQILDQLMDD
jgi:integrase